MGSSASSQKKFKDSNECHRSSDVMHSIKTNTGPTDKFWQSPAIHFLQQDRLHINTFKIDKEPQNISNGCQAVDKTCQLQAGFVPVPIVHDTEKEEEKHVMRNRTTKNETTEKELVSEEPETTLADSLLTVNHTENPNSTKVASFSKSGSVSKDGRLNSDGDITDSQLVYFACDGNITQSDAENIRNVERQQHSSEQSSSLGTENISQNTDTSAHDSSVQTSKEISVSEDSNSEETEKDVDADSKTGHIDTEDHTDTEKILLRNVQETIDSLKGTKWVTKDGKVCKGAKNLLGILQQSSSVIDAPAKIASVLLKLDVFDQICDLIIHIQKQVTSTEFCERIQTLCYTLGVALGVAVNYTDTSEEIAEKITGYPEFLTTIRQILVGFSEKSLHKVFAITEEEVCLTCILNFALSLIYNVSLVDSNVSQLRQLNFTEALQPYLKSKDRDDHLTALAALASIIDEKESEIINSNRKVVKYLMKVLRRALRSDNRRYAGWSCKELALVIKTLARNDANKRLLVQLGALKLLVKLSTGNKEETTEALGAVWALSFDQENRKVMLENEDLGIVAMLSSLRDNHCDKIKTAANGALWNLREDLRSSTNESYKTIGESLVSEGTITSSCGTETGSAMCGKAGGGHIMISYQWSNQKTLIDIRNELNKYGFKVWMDVDNMAGSTLQAMAEAVENADMVLLCYSEKYKNSPNCRAEAEYTFQRQKPFIPLRMELNYKPDGWLGILVGTKLFYDFTGKYDFRDKLNSLLKEIGGLKTQLQGVGSRKPLVPTKSEPLYHHPEVVDTPDTYHGTREMPPVTDIADRVRSWTPDDVSNWLTKHDLPFQECGGLTADEIALLIEMRREAPEAFYKGLQKKFNYDLRLISQLVKALKAVDT